LKFIKNASKSIGSALRSKKFYHVISVKSTVIPGTTDSVVIPLLEQYSQKKVGEDFGVCMTPEFLKEGNSVHDFFNPDKIVIGSYDLKSRNEIYDVHIRF